MWGEEGNSLEWVAGEEITFVCENIKALQHPVLLNTSDRQIEPRGKSILLWHNESELWELLGRERREDYFDVDFIKRTDTEVFNLELINWLHN